MLVDADQRRVRCGVGSGRRGQPRDGQDRERVTRIVSSAFSRSSIFQAICEIADRHLDLAAHDDAPVHQASQTPAYSSMLPGTAGHSLWMELHDQFATKLVEEEEKKEEKKDKEKDKEKDKTGGTGGSGGNTGTKRTKLNPSASTAPTTTTHTTGAGATSALPKFFPFRKSVHQKEKPHGDPRYDDPSLLVQRANMKFCSFFNSTTGCSVGDKCGHYTSATRAMWRASPTRSHHTGKPRRARAAGKCSKEH
jgi:hypothetical protein